MMRKHILAVAAALLLVLGAFAVNSGARSPPLRALPSLPGFSLH